MNQKRRTRSKRQRKKKRVDNSCSEYGQDTSSPSSVFGPDNPSRNAVESEPRVATPSEAELEYLSCGDDAPASEKLVDEPDRFEEEMALGDIQVIQDYMHALLKRHLAVETPILNAEPDFDCQSLPPLAELTARSKPPESIGWASMRELANSQIRAALATHQKIRLSNNTLNNGAAGLACLTGTVTALICAPVLGQTMRIGEMAGVVASIYFLYTSFLSARALLNLRSTIIASRKSAPSCAQSKSK